jgi:hypothetical protein
VRRRVQLPGAAELFRATAASSRNAEAGPLAPATGHVVAVPQPVTPLPPAGHRPRLPTRRPTGRERHDEKITVYLSSTELVELERVRLELRARYGIAVDRGRIVREAVEIVLADLDAHGEASVLIRRIFGQLGGR